MKNPALITPSVMKWARETAGMSVEDAVARFAKSVAKSITVQTVKNWESGKGAPTYRQLEKVARVYQRPLICFYFPKPPKEEPIEKKFRTLPKERAKALPPEIRFLVRIADVFRLNLYELHEEKNPSPHKIFDDIRISPSHDMKKAAAKVRRYLNLPESQKSKNAEEAFEARRDCLEKHGISVFKEPFKNDKFSGFCLHDPQFPIIYINSSTAKSRQSFTLFHELAHILMRKNGFDFRGDTVHTAEEAACNRFAGEVLAPEADIKKYLPSSGALKDDTIESLADQYRVSRAVILRQLRDINFIDHKFFDKKIAQLRKNRKKSPKSESSGFGTYADKLCSYRSKSYTQAVCLQYRRHLIDRHELADYLHITMKHVDDIVDFALY